MRHSVVLDFLVVLANELPDAVARGAEFGATNDVVSPRAWQVGSELRSAGGDSFYREILLMSLFYLIEEHNRVGAPWNSFERLACLLDVILDTLRWGERLIGDSSVN